MLIYKGTSKSEGISYIGQTTRTFEIRLKDHIRESIKPKYQFHESINRYGISDFEFTILVDDITDYKILNIMETYYIMKYDTYYNGYNMTKGGNHTPKHSKESIDKMLKSRYTVVNGLNSYLLGGRKTLETKRNTLLDNGNTLLQETVEKTANTRRKRGDYDEMSKKLKGTNIGKLIKCKHCYVECYSGNFNRWHGDNCKLNPDITQNQLNKRSNGNEGRKMSDEQKKQLSDSRKNKITAFDLETKTFVCVTKTEFKMNRYVGTTNKKVKECLEMK